MTREIKFKGMGWATALQKIRDEFEIYSQKNLAEMQEGIKAEIRLERKAEEIAKTMEGEGWERHLPLGELHDKVSDLADEHFKKGEEDAKEE